MKRLVLVGGGHSHAQVLADWIRRPIDGVDLWVVSPTRKAPYSGMVPGWLAGLYGYDAICIDIASLCGRGHAVFVEDEMLGLDPVRRRIKLRSGPSIDYDLLSLDVGSTLQPPTVDSVHVLALRPLSRLHEGWDALLAALSSETDKPLTIVCVGGGAAGFESLVALHRRIANAHPQRVVDATLVTTGATLLPQLARGASLRAARTLAALGITLRVDSAFVASSLDPGTDRVLLWATGAQAHSWQSSCGLATDADGWFEVDRYLRSTSHPDVFASGDCASWQRPLPKAGVYAVRMGPVLVRNLRAALDERRLRAYRPQRRHLVLLSTADRHAIASWGSLSVEGAWVWRWKDRIDRRFLRRFEPPQPAPASPLNRKEPS